MLAGDATLVEQLDEDTRRILEAAERPALAGNDPIATHAPAGISAERSQIFLLAICSSFD